jgi:hypothetical protein
MTAQWLIQMPRIRELPFLILARTLTQAVSTDVLVDFLSTFRHMLGSHLH